MTTNTEPAKASRDDSVLLAEYQQLTETLTNCEDSGEKRVTVFLAMCAAVGAAVGFVRGNSPLSATTPEPVLVAALLLLFFFGYTTYLRLIRRNLSTDRFKRSLMKLRTHLFEHHEELRDRIMDAYETKPRRPVRWDSLGNGGWLEVIMVFDAVLIGGAVAACGFSKEGNWNFAFGAIAALAAWLLLVRRANLLYRLGTLSEPDRDKASLEPGVAFFMPWTALRCKLAPRRAGGQVPEHA
jgi:hypothetical protein